MAPLYQDWLTDERALVRAACVIAQERDRKKGPPCRLSPLVMMSEPNVHPDIVKAAGAMPRGAAIIYRHFGEDAREAVADTLRQTTFERDQQLLIGNDPALAIKCGADGVHFRRDGTLSEPMLWRGRCPDWLISMAGIKGEGEEGYIDYSGDLSVLDGLFISSVFHSESESAGLPIGREKLLNIAAVLGAPIYALGGINDRTAEALEGYGLAGLAGRFRFSICGLEIHCNSVY